jgi:hypothetical protein
MIKSITVTNYLGDRLKLELARPELSGFVVRSVTGLGPGKANINTSELSTTDGGLFNSSRLPVRNIVMSLEFLWGSSIEDTRQKSYKYFPLKRQVTLLVETDNRVAEISGYVESNEPTIFSQNEGSDISIICPDPYFYSAGEDGIVSTVFYGTEPLFELPYNCETPSEVSAINKVGDRSILYEGDAETGVTIRVHATGKVSNITIKHHNRDTSGSIRIDTDKLRAITGSTMMSGDDIIITTSKGNKSAKLVRGGNTTKILNCLDKHVDWFQLVKGENIFSYEAEDGLANLSVTVENRVLYEGV